MNEICDSMFPFSVDQDYYIYNIHTGVICRSKEKINNALKRFEIPDVFGEGVEPELLNFITASKKIDCKKYKIRNFTKIEKEDWLNGEVVHNLWLSLTENCNLRCRYCFGEYGNNSIENTMSIDTAKRCIDYFFKYANRYVDYYSVRFFGGEPLLNKNVLKFSIEYINEWAQKVGKKIYYLITTNGTLIDNEIMKLILDNNVGVNISVDGNQRTHDFNRIFKDGSGSFDKVIQCIKEFKNNGYNNILARMTLSKTGISSLQDDISFLWDVGFNEIFLDLVETDKEELAVDEKDIATVNLQIGSIFELMKEEYLKTQNNSKVLRNITDVYSFIDQRLIKEACMYYNPFTIQFKSNGEIYKCCRAIGKDSLFAGDVEHGVNWGGYYRNYSYNSGCEQCWAKRLCGGGCHLVKNRKAHCAFSKIMYYYGMQYYTLLNKKNKKTLLNI